MLSRRVVSAIIVIILATCISAQAFNIRRVEAYGTIYIKADGSIDPSTAPIFTDDNVTYTFTDDIFDDLVVQRSHIIVDGDGYTLQGPGWMQFSNGVSLSAMNNVTVKNMTITEFYHGISLDTSSNNNIIIGNNITTSYGGICLDFSQNNTIAGNTLKGNMGGIYLFFSSNNTIVGNNVTAGNNFGIFLSGSSDNLLRNNSMSGNQYNFYASPSPNNVNDVDTSNTVDGKPVYYWVGKQDMTVPLEAGYVALVNCTHMTVMNLSLTNNGDGVVLANTNNSQIVNNNVANNSCGISLHKSSVNNTISENNIANNIVGVSLSSNNTILRNNIVESLGVGIMLGLSSNNIIIRGNNITESQIGIQFLASSNNTVCENNVASNNYGIQLNSGGTLGYSSNNTIYHNNFVNNTQQVGVVEVGDIPPSAYTNFWDNGYPCGGNYWSDYVGSDMDQDGLGDSEYEVDGNFTDNYPLMGMFYCFKTSLGKQVNVVSNSSVESFHFFSSNSSIKMHVSNVTANQTFGFCRLCIHHALMNETYEVTVNGQEPYYVNTALYDNGTSRWVYFAYEHSTLEIIIIPELQSLLILTLLMIVTLLAAIVRKRM